MPYKSIDNLPESVRNSLPIHAQHIFREAFNASIAKYGEVSAFRISWAAVKKKFVKRGDKWVAKATPKQQSAEEKMKFKKLLKKAKEGEVRREVLTYLRLASKRPHSKYIKL